MRGKLLALVHEEWFNKALLYAQGQFYESTDITPDQMKGTKGFIRTLLELPEDEPKSVPHPSSGMVHSLPTRPGDREKEAAVIRDPMSTNNYAN